jgi:hypothetical protein
VITRLEAHDCRCFPWLLVDLGRHHVLAGANGAGKATLLERMETLAGWWPADLPKPSWPKEALEHLGRQRQDPAFNQLHDHLRVWFPEQP